MPGGIGFDFMPFEEERDERRPVGLLGLLEDPERIRQLMLTQARHGTLQEKMKPPPVPGTFSPDYALPLLRQSQVLSPREQQLLKRTGELA